MDGKNTRTLIAAAAAAAALLSACGGNGVPIGAAGLDLPVTSTPRPLASTTVYTSPDGGIYRNPVRLDVLMVARRSVTALAQRLGTTGAWQALQPFGEFTLVGLRLRNDGKAWSEPDVRDLQIASDYAPPQAAGGPLHAFYHPTYPLASVSDTKPGSDCRPHLDPGQSTVVVLVYPPEQIPAQGIVWGRYQEFALQVPQGGGVENLTDRTVAAAVCPANPQQAQTAP
ncbi:MAG TPA: hypothetical protein VN193_12265 [Candidatus Angelobacter sp.]|jgi:hypothetical protein|nr:hypothetical protein [Candidatus Angelobacter sp.]